MFVGREKELAQLNRMYAKNGFQMAVVYGRRRVGKTTLIDAFASDKPTLYFTAQQRSSLQNLVDFSPNNAMTSRFFSSSMSFPMLRKPSRLFHRFCRLPSITV